MRKAMEYLPDRLKTPPKKIRKVLDNYIGPRYTVLIRYIGNRYNGNQYNAARYKRRIGK